MALNDNDAQNIISAFSQALSSLTNNTNATIYDIIQLQKDLEKALRDFPASDIEELRNSLNGTPDEIADSLNRLIRGFNDSEREQSEYASRVREIVDEIELLNDNLENANEDDLEYLENRREQRERELRELEEQHQAYINGQSEQRRLDQDLEEERRRREEEQARQEEQAEEERRQRRDKAVDTITDGVSAMLSTVTSMFTSAVNRVVDTYEKSAGTLAAALDSTVGDISKLQSDIANALQDESLSSAISNIAVMNEASSLVSSGYTNEDKLQENATAIAIGKEIAPNLSLDNANVKNLTNIFGSDFIDKFSAIQQASQETAGSVIDINSNLTKMMDDLAPVYQNAEYNNVALQDTSDIQATLSAAMDSGLITESQKNEYLNMISELMDPSKAFKSSSTAVRVAATNYDFGSGSPMQALQALLNARGDMYSNVGMGNNYQDNVSRSLVAAAYGDNTMDATYMQSGLYGLDILHTNDLSNVYADKKQSLEEGDYTTQKQKEENYLDNSGITQSVAKLAEWFPATYATFSATLFATINTLPRRIANAIKSSGAGLGGGSGSGGLGGRGGLGGGNPPGGGGGGNGLGGILRNARGPLGTLARSGFANSSLLGLGTAGSGLAQMTSGFGLGMIGLGVAGTASTISQWDSDRSLAQNIGHGGNTLSAILSNAGTGAGIGAVAGSFIPGLGNIAGAGIGALIGAITGLTTSIVANKEQQKANTEALEAQTNATKGLLGSGVTGLDKFDAEREIARGGGIAHLASGDYKIDYKKSSYAGFASGLDYVPKDDFIARLHKGEAVLTADAADELRRKDPNFFNKAFKQDSEDNIVNALKEQTTSIVDAVRGDKEFSPLTQVGPKQYKISNPTTGSNNKGGIFSYA